MLTIDTRLFYNIGCWCFGIAAIMNTITFVSNSMNGNFTLASMVVSAAASLVFNYAIFGFFFWLRSNLPPKDLKAPTLDDMNAVLKGEEENTKKAPKLID